MRESDGRLGYLTLCTAGFKPQGIQTRAVERTYHLKLHSLLITNRE